MNMIRCPLRSILRTRKASEGPFVFGENLISFAISDTVAGRDGSLITPLRSN